MTADRADKSRQVGGWGGPQAALLPGGRLHLQHGPIDLVIAAEGDQEETKAAFRQAGERFGTVLEKLVEEQPVLRTAIGNVYPEVEGWVAQRMIRAVWPYRASYITPMAAVAGSVADEVLSFMLAGRRLKRAYVNNGGDIALHLTPGTRFRVGVVTDIERPALSGHIEIGEATAVRGIATSGRGGRSLSMGIADAVTTLAETAADADAAATMIANSIDLDHRAVKRRPASAIDETSDLGSLPVVVAVGDLDEASINEALDTGERYTRHLIAEGRITGALLALKGGIRAVGELGRLRLGQER